ncbi:myosin [Thraustotheca clavata]|uniref:Myosin n=1 Tax=Thraustotheca clavata TaxID=74557 RepID=A0A1W0AAF2_9STRA|nr:myosin [Thraustotheca clavata]
MIRRSLARRKFLKEKRMATRLCAFGRMIIARRNYLLAKRRIVIVQSLIRRYLQGKHYRNIRKQFVALQACWRRKKCVQSYQHARNAIITIQSFGKMIPCRREFLKSKQAATCLASYMRMYLAKKEFKLNQKRIVKIQSLVRQWIVRKRYKQKVRYIVMVQAHIRSCLARRVMDKQRRGMMRVVMVMKKYLARIRLQKKIKAMFAAAQAFDLTTILRLSQDKDIPNSTLVRVRDKSNFMRSLVHIAAINCDLNLARFVLSEIPNMEDQVISKDTLGNTPLHYAARLAHLDMVKLLAKVANRIQAPPPAPATPSTSSTAAPSPANAARKDSRSPSGVLRKNSSFGTPRSPADVAWRSPSMGGTGSLVPSTPHQRKRRALVSSASQMPSLSTPVELPPDTTKVVKAGLLRMAIGSKMASKRYVVLDPVAIAAYKTEKDRIPVKILELCDATLRRASTIEHCFEIISPRLKSHVNSSGIVSFVAESEAEVHEWMLALREITGVRISTTVPANHNMICIDIAQRKEFVNCQNNHHESPLHLAVQNSEDEGFEAVKTSVWLIENEADINAKDTLGNTPLHYAVMECRDDLVESLLKKGALTTIRNNNNETPIDLATEEYTREQLAPGAVVVIPADRSLLPRPSGKMKVQDGTYVSVLLSAVAIAGGVMQAPYFRIYSMDPRRSVVDTPQTTPDALIQDGPSLWFGNTWHLQMPLEHMTEGCVAVFELLRYDYHTDGPEVFCWTFFRLDLSKITSAPLTFEMYSPPVDPYSQILARVPGDSFFNAELNISL